MSDEDYGQVDGDESVEWYPTAGMPWLRPSQPPWHMWGNTQLIEVPIETTGAVRLGVTNQLVRISYARPETWHWLFYARMVSGPANTPGFFTRVFVNWELTTGVGRSAVRMHLGTGQLFAIPAFDTFTFQWGPTRPEFPTNAQIWASEATSPSKSFQGDGPAATGETIKEIVAQDLQLQAQVVGLTTPLNVLAAGQTAIVEVSAIFAPKTHVRPDWFINGPQELMFSGAEIQGR